MGPADWPFRTLGLASEKGGSTRPGHTQRGKQNVLRAAGLQAPEVAACPERSVAAQGPSLGLGCMGGVWKNQEGPAWDGLVPLGQRCVGAGSGAWVGRPTLKAQAVRVCGGLMMRVSSMGMLTAPSSTVQGQGLLGVGGVGRV